MSDRAYIEEPDLGRTGPDGQPLQQRTMQQQAKQENLAKLQRRDVNDYSNRSRSSSRRHRRKRIQDALEDRQYMKTNSLTALEEADANGEALTMQPFERIGPDSTSMDGPVSHARARRSEIPVRGTNGKQPYYLEPQAEKSVSLHHLQISLISL